MGGDFMDDIPDNIRRALFDLFTDPRWRKLLSSRWIYYGEIDGVIIGVCISTFNALYQEFNLNCDELKRLVDAKANGKVTLAFVVDTKMRTCIGAADAVKLAEKLENVPPRTGRFGEFWSAPIFTSDEEEPF
jgi:hypothetical protein